MGEPRLVELPAGTFYRAMRGEGKRGDQHQVTRVTNDRALADRLLAIPPSSGEPRSGLCAVATA